MIVSKTNTVPTVDGLILLDCWEPAGGQFFKDYFYANLIHQLQEYNFKCIVNSLTHNQFDWNDRSLRNTFQRYCWTYNDDLRNSSTETPTEADFWIALNILKSSGQHEQTSCLVQRYLLDNEQSIFLNNDVDFLHHTSLLPEPCRHWIVAGHSWQMCTHNHGLGLERLANISYFTGMNFYAAEYSFCKLHGGTAMREDFESDTFEWEFVKGLGYRLMPTKRE